MDLNFWLFVFPFFLVFAGFCISMPIRRQIRSRNAIRAFTFRAGGKLEKNIIWPDYYVFQHGRHELRMQSGSSGRAACGAMVIFPRAPFLQPGLHIRHALEHLPYDIDISSTNEEEIVNNFKSLFKIPGNRQPVEEWLPVEAQWLMLNLFDILPDLYVREDIVYLRCLKPLSTVEHVESLVNLTKSLLD